MERCLDCRPGMPYQISRLLIYGALRGFCGLRLYGREHIPERGPAMLLANHESYIDPYIVTFMTWRPVVYVAKEELFSGIGGYFFPRMNVLPVKRGAADLSMFRNAAKVLASGQLMGMFPEGTRSEDGRLKSFHSGALSIPLKATVPIVPIGVAGTYEVMPRSGGLRFGKVGAMAGPPLRFAHLDPNAYRDKAALKYVADRLAAEIRRLRREVRRRLELAARDE